jgi:hypothetical protein
MTPFVGSAAAEAAAVEDAGSASPTDGRARRRMPGPRFGLPRVP